MNYRECESSDNRGNKRFHWEWTVFPAWVSGFCFCLMLVFPGSAQAESTLMIDTRLMLLAHPLVHNFDPSTRKFQHTSSQPLSDGEAGVSELKNELLKLEKELQELLKDLSKNFKNATSSENSKRENEYWKKRKMLEKKIAGLEARISETNMVPGQPGLTGYSSILPQVNEISQDMTATIRELSERAKATSIIDISSLAPLTPDQLPAYDSKLLCMNLHFYPFQKKALNREVFSPWLKEAKKYWAVRDFRWVSPVPFGAKDMRNEAARMMEKKGKK
ncbi:MAG: hypothetical protein WA705_25600 [Candidatus Ozemobacteraceae bacterium]